MGRNCRNLARPAQGWMRAGTGMLGAAIALAFAHPAQAQSQQSMTVRTAIFGELTITKSRNLDFGDIAGPNAGTVTMSPFPNAQCATTGGLVHVGLCQPAEFGSRGENGKIIRIKRPSGDKIVLTGPGANMQIDNLVIDGSPELQAMTNVPGYSRFRINSATGIFSFRLAGRLNVGANQAPGVYTGTFQVSLQYQ